MTSVQNKIGAVLQGRYRILGFLGRGGMGTVYQCEDLRLSGKRWAIKEMTVYDPASQEQIEESFKREAQMLSSLRHRNLPMIVDYFIEDSRQYLVMEFIEGQNLGQVIQKEGPASELQAMRWALEICQVLDYLHRQDKPVIFRDLKPDNIIISEDRHIKLVDFGLARQFEPGKRRDTQASGSVGYAPPEQWEDAAQTDERSDVYSLGATLFYVLTGKAPSPVYGSQRLRPYRPELDVGAEALVLKCLQPDPSQRYANSSELIRDLLLWLSKQPTEVSGSRPLAPPLTEIRGEAAPVEGGPASGQIPSGATPKPPPLTPPWLLRWLQLSTLIFVAASLLGLHQFWAQKQPPPLLQDPLQKVLDDSRESKNQALQYLAQKDYTRAIEQLDRLLTRYPEDAEAHILNQNAYILFQNKPHYTIPVLTSTSGNDREGIQLYPGLALAQKQINQAGGIRNHLVFLQLYDTASRQDRVIELARKLANDSQVQVVIGPWTSHQVIASAPIFDDGKLPALAPAASDPRVWEAGRYIFTASESDAQRVACIARYMIRQGWKKVAVFTAQDSVVSRSESAEFADAFNALGGKVALQMTYGHLDNNFEVQLDALQEKGVEAVFLAEYRSDVVLRFARQLRKRSARLPLATQVVAFSSSVVLEGGNDVEGVLTSTYFHPAAPDPRIGEFDDQFVRLFVRLRPSHREAYAYDSLKLVAEAIQAVGFEREALTAYLRQVGTSERPAFVGVSGEFAPGRRLDRRKPYLVQIRKGQYELIPES